MPTTKTPAGSTPGAPHPRHIVMIDVGPAVHQRAGLSRYAHQLAAGVVAQQPADLDFLLFYNRHSNHSPPAGLAALPKVTLPLAQYPWRLGALASQLLRRRLIPVEQAAARQVGYAPHLYHATEHLLPNLQIPAVLTVHDLIFEWLPQHHTRLNRSFLRLAMPRFLQAAAAIIAVSAHTAHDIVARYHIDTAKITVIYEGVDTHFRPAAAETVARIRAAYSPDAPYLLMVGTLEPRKNHALAIRALKRLRDTGHPHRLLIAGGDGWLFESVQELIHELELSDAVSFTGYVPAEDLPGLYSAADCFLLPSLYEGFGLPVLEAMACGTPVVCSNVSSLPEVAGNAALLISAHDDEMLATTVQRVLTEPGLAAHMRYHGFAQAARFRWDTCAAQTIDLYRHVLQENR